MRFVDDLDHPQFFTPDVCRATGAKPHTLKSWISRKPPAILLGDVDRPAKGSGRHHLFSLRRVLQIAITVELTGLGFAPREAGMIAAGFSDVGDGTSSHSKRPRLPGEVYPSGCTLLLAYPGRRDGVVANVELSEPWHRLTRSFGAGHADSVVVVNVNSIDARVRSAVGLPRPQPNEKKG